MMMAYSQMFCPGCCFSSYLSLSPLHLGHGGMIIVSPLFSIPDDDDAAGREMIHQRLLLVVVVVVVVAAAVAAMIGRCLIT